MKCKRGHYGLLPLVWRTGGGDRNTWFTARRDENADAVKCDTCYAWLSLGESNDSPPAVKIEIKLAELLAENECFWEPCGAKDEQEQLVIDIFADDGPNPNQRPANRPRTPIEIMVDAACGVSQ